MGWRIDFYKANKNEPLILTTEEDGYVSAEVNGERILDDIATDVWCELKRQEKFQKEIVCLYEHPDCDYYSITKKGFEWNDDMFEDEDDETNITEKLVSIEKISE